MQLKINAAKSLEQKLNIYLEYNIVSGVRHCLAKGADPNWIDSPSVYSTRDVECLLLLLAYGARVDLPDKYYKYLGNTLARCVTSYSCGGSEGYRQQLELFIRILSASDLTEFSSGSLTKEDKEQVDIFIEQGITLSHANAIDRMFGRIPSLKHLAAEQVFNDPVALKFVQELDMDGGVDELCRNPDRKYELPLEAIKAQNELRHKDSPEEFVMSSPSRTNIYTPANSATRSTSTNAVSEPAMRGALRPTPS